jgi:hypothetical protein
MAKLHEFVTSVVDGPGQSDLQSRTLYSLGRKTPGIPCYWIQRVMVKANVCKNMNCHKFYPLLLNKTNYRFFHFQ